MARNRYLVRVLRLAAALQARRWTLIELAVDFEVSTRTIRRDIYALEESAYLPIQHIGELWWIERSRGRHAA